MTHKVNGRLCECVCARAVLDSIGTSIPDIFVNRGDFIGNRRAAFELSVGKKVIFEIDLSYM